jgi:uncharacterized protein YacL
MILRAGFILVLSTVGLVAGLRAGQWATGLLSALLVSTASVCVELLVRRLSVWAILGGAAGLLLGVLSAWLISFPLAALPAMEVFHLDVLTYVLFGYTGLAVGLARGRDFSFSRVLRAFSGKSGGDTLMLVDTSAIIDGRIADICETGFLEGPFIIPQFILQELQHIADSSDGLKRTRGRRGLDVLQRIKKMSGLEVRIVEEDFPRIREVDAKLVALARATNAKIITNDFNLNKVCQVQGIPVLNVNELSNALRPVVLPGEAMRVYVLKEGKEANQGVAYLDDGTMVVIESGRKMIGRKLEVTVTSVLQTTAGRMIFARSREEGAGAAERQTENGRNNG